MYFNSIPNIRSIIRPSKYPFSEGDYVIAKNFFRRFNIDDKIFSNLVFFTQYTIEDGDRPDLLAEDYYGNPFYDWIIFLTNNMIGGLYDWPLDNQSLINKVESEHADPYNTVHHYETKKLLAGYKVEDIDVVALEGGLTVDEKFYTGTFRYYNGQETVSIPGSSVSYPVSIYADEERKNNEKRKIYILKKRYLNSFIDAFKIGNKYGKSSDFVTSKIKKTSI